MTLRDFLIERSFADERTDSNHPIQADVERKLTSLLYDIKMKPMLDAFENKYHLLDKSYEEAKTLLGGKEEIGKFNEASLKNWKDDLSVEVYCSWDREEPEDKDRYHNISSGDSWKVTLRKNSWDADKKVYKKFLDGDIDTLIKSKVGAGRWNLYKGQTFWIGDKGFKLTDDYKIVDANSEDFKNYNEYSSKQIAEWFWTKNIAYGKYPSQITNICSKAKEKFDNSKEFEDWLNTHPDKKTRLNDIMTKFLGKRRT